MPCGAIMLLLFYCIFYMYCFGWDTFSLPILKNISFKYGVKVQDTNHARTKMHVEMLQHYKKVECKVHTVGSGHAALQEQTRDVVKLYFYRI